MCSDEKESSTFHSELVHKNRGIANFSLCVAVSLFFSHRSLTRQLHDRCSKCLRRLTKTCTREEEVEEEYSRDCRMNVSSGPLVSLIFGRLFSYFLPTPTSSSSSETGQQ